VIEVRGVSKRYPPATGRRRAVLPVAGSTGGTLALDGTSALFPGGELCVLLGPSGSGKSTLLRLLNRMIEPDEGRVLIDGVDTRELDPVLLRRRTGYVIQGIGLFPHMSVAENVGVVPRLLGWDAPRRARRIEELLDILRLPRSFAGRMPRELSGGEAQRVGVARALAADPPTLLMDEPFGALDVLTRENLQEEFARIQAELRKTVVFVTHDVAEAVRLADRLLVMRSGRILRSGRPMELLADPRDPGEPDGDFVSAFLGPRFSLELLGRERALRFAEFETAAAVGAEAPQGEPLGPGASLRDALARMLAERRAELPVAAWNGAIGRLRLERMILGPAGGGPAEPAGGR
jgi:osmoprotectant transport system ATP-binding protein